MHTHDKILLAMLNKHTFNHIIYKVIETVPCSWFFHMRLTLRILLCSWIESSNGKHQTLDSIWFNCLLPYAFFSWTRLQYPESSPLNSKEHIRPPAVINYSCSIWSILCRLHSDFSNIHHFSVQPAVLHLQVQMQIHVNHQSLDHDSRGMKMSNNLAILEGTEGNCIMGTSVSHHHICGATDAYTATETHMTLFFPTDSAEPITHSLCKPSQLSFSSS